MNKNCGRYCADNCVNACTNKTVTYDCTPWNPKQWVKPAIPKGMDPGLYNVLNGCWLCNFYRQEEENEYLCSRSFKEIVFTLYCFLFLSNSKWQTKNLHSKQL